MAYDGYYSNIELRQKLGNTIAGNFDDILLTNARKYGDDWIDAATQRDQVYQDSGVPLDPNQKHGWTQTDQLFDLAKGIAMEVAGCWLRSTQINVSIQAQREYAQAQADAALILKQLINLGIVQTSGRFFVDQYVTDVLNPLTGTRVTSHGIVPSRKSLIALDSQIM